MEAIATADAPAAIGPYSQAIVWNQLIFASGQIPLDPVTGQIVEGDISAQTNRVLDNLAAVLAAAGGGFDTVLKTTIYLADMALELAMMGENPADAFNKAVYAPGEITTADAAVLDRYFNYGMVQIQRLQKMDELGLAYEGWHERVNYLRWHFGNEVGRRWWNQVRGGYPEEFRETVDSILTEDSLDENRTMIDALMPSEKAE